MKTTILFFVNGMEISKQEIHKSHRNVVRNALWTVEHQQVCSNSMSEKLLKYEHHEENLTELEVLLDGKNFMYISIFTNDTEERIV